MRKLDKNKYPDGCKPEDFSCSGPPAIKDGEFDECYIADLGCFDQDERDSNKYYHGAICRSKKDNSVWVYFEWGRTGGGKPSFQFISCATEAEARRVFSAQLHEKNDRRGRWIEVAGIRTLQAKPGKDCYLVRPMATRNTGLPDALTIHFNDGAKGAPAPAASTGRSVDEQTWSLLRDLDVATVEYTRGVMSDSSLPTQAVIDEARRILQEALGRIKVVGDDLAAQVADRDMVQYSKYLYGRIPKRKPRHAGPQVWVLSEANIKAWQDDLDTFESALYSDTHATASDPFDGMPIHMEWVDPSGDLGRFLYDWWPKASNNRHTYLGRLTLKNIWRIDRDGQAARLAESQRATQGCNISNRPLFQPERIDLDGPSLSLWEATNTALLFHGTRSVNVPGLLRWSFRLPRDLVNVHFSGAMFGGGLYYADDWMKSAGYTSVRQATYTAGSGGVRNRAAFMFAVDVLLGSPYVAPHGHGYTRPPEQHHSVMGKAKISRLKEGSSSRLENNEFVIYDVNQQNIRYLAEFTAQKET